MKSPRSVPDFPALALFGGLAVLIATSTGLFGKAGLPLALVAAAVAGYAAYRALDQSRSVRSRLRHVEESRRLARIETERQRASIDAFADGLEVGIVICDADVRVVYANRTAREMFGTPSPIGRALLAMTLSPEIEALVDEAAEDARSVEREIAFHRPGDRVALVKAWNPDPDEGRTFLSLIEISDLRRLERVRRDFVANVSHELRTPMTIIRAYAETLLDDDDSELRARYLGKIVSEVDRLTSISHDLLVLSAAESGTVASGPTDLAEIVKSTVGALQRQAQDKGLALRYEGPETLVIAGNSAQMTQVAINLVENAVKYSREGTIRVTLAARERDAELCVVDTGIGIGSEHIERIFERFYRVDKGRTRRDANVGGTGLGLAIVKHIVEAHGGSVSVESVLNVGSTFCARLPFATASVAPDRAEETPATP